MEFSNISEIVKIICNAPGSWYQSLSHGEKLIIDVLDFLSDGERHGKDGWNIYCAIHHLVDSCLKRGRSMMEEYRRR